MSRNSKGDEWVPESGKEYSDRIRAEAWARQPKTNAPAGMWSGTGISWAIDPSKLPAGALIYLAPQAAPAQPAAQPPYLLNGARFKLNFDGEGTVFCFRNYFKELQGRWVALVAAEDDCHLKPPAQPVAQPVGINGLTDAETDASMSVRGLSKPTVKESLTDQPTAFERELAWRLELQAVNQELLEALIVYAKREEQEGFFESVAHKAIANVTQDVPEVGFGNTVNQELLAALTHAVEIAESKRDGTWDDLLQYRAAITKAEGAV